MSLNASVPTLYLALLLLALASCARQAEPQGDSTASGQVVIHVGVVEPDGSTCKTPVRIAITGSDGALSTQWVMATSGNISATVDACTSARINAFRDDGLLDQSPRFAPSGQSGLFLGDLQPGSSLEIDALPIRHLIPLVHVKPTGLMNVKEEYWTSVLRPGNNGIVFQTFDVPFTIFSDDAWTGDFYLRTHSIDTIDEKGPLQVGSSVASDLERRGYWFRQTIVPPEEGVGLLSVQAEITGKNGGYPVHILTSSEGGDWEYTTVESRLPGPGAYRLRTTGFCDQVVIDFVVIDNQCDIGPIRLWSGWSTVQFKVRSKKVGPISRVEVLTPGSTSTWCAVGADGTGDFRMLAPQSWSLTARAEINGGHRYFGIQAGVRSVELR